MGLTRSIGVSNWNTTEMQDLKDAGLTLPSATQIQWMPGMMQPNKTFNNGYTSEHLSPLLCS